METSLRDKVAVVTGASKGIGAAIARTLAGRGAFVIVNYASSEEGAAEVVRSIERAGGRATAVRADVTVERDVDALFAAAEKVHGKVDILVNNAGRFGASPIASLTTESITDTFAVNVFGLLLATKAAAALMPAEGGSIVNIGSMMAEVAPPEGSVLVGSKAAVNAMTRSLAKELGPKKIRVNTVNPGPVDTEGFRSSGLAGSPIEAQMIAMTPLGRVGTVDEIAAVVAFLVSDDARWVTGALIDAAGGMR